MSKLSQQEERELISFIKDWLKSHGFNQKDLANELNIKSIQMPAIIFKLKEFYKKDLMNSGILWEEGCHSEQTILSAEMLIKSPGIPEIELLVKARSKGIEVLSEIEFAYRFTNGKIIAVTGSNGKTTTASLIHHILKKAKLKKDLRKL